MKIVTELPHPVVENPDVGIVLADGCRLSARVWMPADAAAHPVPAVLEYIPYRKRDGTLARDEIMHPYVAGHGYACVRVDMRGNGDSDGLMSDEYSEQELADACEVIAWLAAQPWCSGSVGMMGKSWGGFNCLQTAFLQPPALKAVISVYSTTDRFESDIHFKGGCLLGENIGWGAVMLSYSSRPADPALRDDWREQWLERLEAEPFLAPRWASHQSYDAYWKHGSVREDYARMQMPVLSFGGWADNYMNTVGHLVANVPAPVQGIVGPWVHQYPHQAVPGPTVGFLQLAIRWWDRWLKGIENGAESDPAMRAYMLHSAPPDASAPHREGHWLAESTWPSDRTYTRQMALSFDGMLDGDGGLLELPISTPQHLGLDAGEFFPMGLNAEMPGDQRHDDAMSLCFDTRQAETPVELLGAAVLKLRLVSDKPRGFIVARLCDVAPDGSSVRIAHGMLNLCHRDSRETPAPVPVGEEIAVELVLDQMAYRLAPGHRLRLALSNSYWPFLWPSPEPVTLILQDGMLELPVHEESGPEWQPPPAEGAAPWKHRVLREGSAARRVERDLISGRWSLIVEDDGGERENLTHGLVSGETLREVWSIHPDDPLSARAEIFWEQRLSRGDWSVMTRCTTLMTGDADGLRMQADLQAYEGDSLILARSFDETVPRDFI